MWPVDREGWPQEALKLLWRPAGEDWLPEQQGAAYAPRLETPAYFGSIGWGVLAPRLPDPPSFLAFKNGSLAANHTHLDLNTVSLGYGDEMLLVDLGSRPYPADYFDAKKRYTYYEITTRGHNTVLVGGRGQVLGKQGDAEGGGVGRQTSLRSRASRTKRTRSRRRGPIAMPCCSPTTCYVLVDDLQHATPQTIELRFHTYGLIAGAGQRFTFTGDKAALDVIVASPGTTARVESPDGWIKPVNALSVTRPAATSHTVVTVFHPRATSDTPMVSAQVRETPSGLVVSVGAAPCGSCATRAGSGSSRAAPPGRSADSRVVCRNRRVVVQVGHSSGARCVAAP